MWDKGKIALDTGELIAAPGMLLDELKNASVPTQQETLKHAPHIVRAGIGPVDIDRCEAYLTEFFHNRVLTELLLVASEQLAQNVPGIEHIDRDEFEFYSHWVKKMTDCAPPCKFGWGGISAVQDHWTLQVC